LLLQGDDRHSVVPSLAVLHTLFVREHNRLAKALGYLNPMWNDEKIFQEARKIVAAMLQHITYNEYLPSVIGKAHMKAYGLYSKPKGFSTVYDPKVNPTVSNAFGVAAFRYGHSQIPNLQGQLYNDFKKIKAVPVERTFNRPSMLFDDYGKGCERNGLWQANSVQAKTGSVTQLQTMEVSQSLSSSESVNYSSNIGPPVMLVINQEETTNKLTAVDSSNLQTLMVPNPLISDMYHLQNNFSSIYALAQANLVAQTQQDIVKQLQTEESGVVQALPTQQQPVLSPKIHLPQISAVHQGNVRKLNPLFSVF